MEIPHDYIFNLELNCPELYTSYQILTGHDLENTHAANVHVEVALPFFSTYISLHKCTPTLLNSWPCGDDGWEPYCPNTTQHVSKDTILL